MSMRFLLALTLLAPAVLSASEVAVQNADELHQALRSLQNGTTLKIAPGDYPGGHHVVGVEKLTIEALDEKNYAEELEKWTEEYTEALCQEYASLLQKEYEYLTSREAMEENIRANEYEFNEDGEIS